MPSNSQYYETCTNIEFVQKFHSLFFLFILQGSLIFSLTAGQTRLPCGGRYTKTFTRVSRLLFFRYILYSPLWSTPLILASSWE